MNALVPDPLREIGLGPDSIAAIHLKIIPEELRMLGGDALPKDLQKNRMRNFGAIDSRQPDHWLLRHSAFRFRRMHIFRVNR